MSRREIRNALMILSALLPLAIAACQQSTQEPASGTPDAADVTAADAQPAAQASAAGSDDADAMPVKKPVVDDATVPAAPAEPTTSISASGYGVLRFGMTRGEAEKAMGSAFDAPARNDCQQVRRSGQPDVSYLFDGGKLQRIDVKTPHVIANGGGHVGMQADEIRTLYAGKIAESPSKYVKGGLYLKAVDESGNGVVFETDANGAVTSFRAGLAPALDLVEGCS